MLIITLTQVNAPLSCTIFFKLKEGGATTWFSPHNMIGVTCTRMKSEDNGILKYVLVLCLCRKWHI